MFNPELTNAMMGGLNRNTFTRVLTQVAASGKNNEARRRVRENRERQAHKFNTIMLLTSPYLSKENRERVSLVSPGLRKALKPVVEMDQGKFRFGNSGLSVNSNSILTRLRKSVQNRNVSKLLNELKNESVNVNGQIIKKNRLLHIELLQALQQLYNYLSRISNSFRNTRQGKQQKIRITRAFIARYGDLTSGDVKMIINNVNSNVLSRYITARRNYKNGILREPSRRIRELPAYRGGIGPYTERRLRSNKKPSNYSRR